MTFQGDDDPSGRLDVKDPQWMTVYAANVEQIDFHYNDVFNIGHDSYGVVLANDVTLFRVRSGSIDSAFTGIHAPCGYSSDQNRSNVVLEQGATIENCITGIHIGKGGIVNADLDYGLISMRCSKLLDNVTGIEYVDILLYIDSWLHSTKKANLHPQAGF